MSKPIVNIVNVFDSSADHDITFTYSGDQPYYNRIIVMDALLNTTVFDETVESRKFIHTIPAHTLTNDTSYSVQISVTNSDGVVSSLSDKIYFTCYSSPSASFVGLSYDLQNEVKSASYQATVDYFQPENRLLKQYKFNIYDNSQHLITSSDIFYYTDNSAITYDYRNLESDTIYYLRFIGETVDGVETDSGYVKIYVTYNVSNAMNSFTARCDTHGGYIQCSTHITSIDGLPIGDCEISNGIVDLLNSKIVYDDGVMINDDFICGISILDMADNETLLYMTNTVNSLSLLHYIYNEDHIFKLIVTNGIEQYVLYSDLISVAEHEEITIYIKRVNNLYDLIIKQKG